MSTRRVSLGKAETLEGAAAELLALLQTISADSKLSTAEIRELHRWLKGHQNAGLPSVEFLKVTIEAIAADGKVTDEERLELFKAIEKVLPPDLREIAKQRRRMADLARREQARELARQQGILSSEDSREEAAAGEFDFMIAGVAFEGRATVAATMQAGATVYLIRDRANAYSRNAVEVRTENGWQLGYVPEEDARELSPLLDRGYKHAARIKKVLAGGNFPIPVVVAEIYRPESGARHAVEEAAVPARRSLPESRATGCGLFAFLGLAGAMAGILLLRN